MLAWKIPWTEWPGALKSIGSQRVKILLSTYTAVYKKVKLTNDFQFCVNNLLETTPLQENCIFNTTTKFITLLSLEKRRYSIELAGADSLTKFLLLIR